MILESIKKDSEGGTLKNNGCSGDSDQQGLIVMDYSTLRLYVYYVGTGNFKLLGWHKSNRRRLPIKNSFTYGGQKIEHSKYVDIIGKSSIEHYQVINGGHTLFDFEVNDKV